MAPQGNFGVLGITGEMNIISEKSLMISFLKLSSSGKHKQT